MTLWTVIGWVAFAFALAAAIWFRLSLSEQPEPISLDDSFQPPVSDEAKAARGIRAKLAMEEFLAPAIHSLGAEYLTALTQLAANEPWETTKITKLAIAQRVIKAVEQQIILAVMDGEQATGNLERAKVIAAMPEAKRKWLNGV